MAVGQHPQICPSREREKRMFHRGQVIFGKGIEDITDKKVSRRMPLRQQLSPLCSCLTNHAPSLLLSFGVSLSPPYASRVEDVQRFKRVDRGFGIAASWVQSHLIGVSESHRAQERAVSASKSCT